MEQRVFDLNGRWNIRYDPEDTLEKKGIVYDTGFTAEDWEEINVPSHWQVEGYDYQGVVWYYKKFSLPKDFKLEHDKKAFLKFGGVDYLSQVWLNGVYLGIHEGDFDSFQFEVSNILNKENNLFVKVESWVDSRPEFKEVIKGGIYHWDCLPIKQKGLTDCPEVPSAANPRYPNPVINPGGIWKPVYLEVSKPYHIEKVKLTPQFINGQEKAYLYIQFQIYNWLQNPVKLEGKLLLEPENFTGKKYLHSFSIELKPGQNYFTETVELDKPALWWTWDLGEPNLYQFLLTLNNEDEEVIRYEDFIGIREVKKGDNWELYLNGKRFFARGTNYLSGQFLSNSTPERYDTDLKLMLNANMNMIRVFSHMENEYFYRQCDRKGILIWQDLPFQWGYETDPYFIKRAESIAERFVKKLYNHPSIFLWCCHSESRYHDYNKLDRIIETRVKKIDPHRPVWRDSVLMTTGQPPEFFKDLEGFEDYINNHLSVHWVGWYWGKIENADYYNPLFVTEFGTQSVPDQESLKKFIAKKDLWPPNWEEWRYRGFQTDIYRKNLGDFPEKLAELIQITQVYQHRFYKQHIETLRRKKYQNVNGLLQFHFVSSWPAIDWSIIDYYRRPKKAYFTIKNAFNPVLLSFTGQFSDKGVKILTWIINDLQQVFKNLVLEWQVLVAGEVIFTDKVEIAKVEADSAQVYLEKDLQIDAKRVEVKGRLFQGDRELSSNHNLLVPRKEPANIETPAVV